MALNLENKLTPELEEQLTQGTKVRFKWYGSPNTYTGRIEVDEHGTKYFINEHAFQDDKLMEHQEGMRYYNPLSSFAIFNEFEILN